MSECELFEALTLEETAELRGLCSPFAVVEDAVLFMEGRRASYLYVVVAGQIALQKLIRSPHAKQPRRTAIAICRPGDPVGWSALVEPYEYTLSALAWESSDLVRIDSATLRRVLNADPAMGYKVMKSLSALIARRLRQTATGLINERELSLARDRV